MDRRRDAAPVCGGFLRIAPSSAPAWLEPTGPRLRLCLGPRVAKRRAGQRAREAGAF